MNKMNVDNIINLLFLTKSFYIIILLPISVLV